MELEDLEMEVAVQRPTEQDRSNRMPQEECLLCRHLELPECRPRSHAQDPNCQGEGRHQFL